MGLCQRQFVDSVVEDWWLFPRNLLLFWMRHIEQRGSETSPYFDGCFAQILCARSKISPYVRAYLYPTEFH